MPTHPFRIAFLCSVFEHTIPFFLCGFFTLKTESCFNNNAIILFSKDHHFLALSRLLNKENRNQHIAEADAYKQNYFPYRQSHWRTASNATAFESNLFTFAMNSFLSFCHNSQFFIDFLFGACVRLFARWRGLFNVSHATRIHKTRWNCINFHCCFDLEVVFFFLSLGILPCGACANNTSSAPMCLFSSFFHCILEFSTQWHWHYKSNWLDDLNSGSAFSYFEKKRTKINTLD